MAPIRTLAFTSVYPNREQPRHGIFLEHRLRHIADTSGLDLEIVAPVPWFPLASSRFGRYAQYARVPAGEVRSGLRVAYPRYPVISKIGMTVAPILMAAWMLWPLLRARRRGFDFDVIDSYYLYPDGVAAVILGRLLGRPVLLTALGSDVSLIPRYRLPRLWLKWATRRAGGLTAVCQALKSSLEELGVDPRRISVIRHGVDLDLFRPPHDRPALRARVGATGPTLILVGHLIKRKGHDIAIEAMTRLPGMTLWIAGDGPEEAYLRRLVAKHGLAGRVRFLGHVDQADLVAYLGAADVLINCSDREGIANVLLEALACGTPVAATPIWGTPEVVTAPEAGALLSGRSPDALASGVRDVLARQISRPATRRFAEQFSWRQTSAEHLRALQDALRSQDLDEPSAASSARGRFGAELP
jgi:teichuronic acid biosynthesis glycosyltransferase TuaC